MKALFAAVVSLLLVAVCAGAACSEWYSYTIADGLMDDAVYGILADHSGNLWFRSFCGVTWYDGINWQRYLTTVQGRGVPEPMAMAEDHLGNLWVGGVNGVNRYDGVTWRTYTTADGLASDEVWAIAEDHFGNLWFGTENGLSRYDGVSWRTYTAADGLAGNRVTAVAVDYAGHIWVVAGGYATRYDGVSWHRFVYVGADVIVQDRNGRFWFGGSNGVFRHDGATWIHFTTADGLPSDWVTSIAEDRWGNIWCGTFDSGACRYDGTAWRTYSVADGLVSNYVLAIAADFSGNLWFGTYYGLGRYDGVTWRTYTTADGLASNEVRAALQDRSGDFWFATYWSGVSRFDGVNWRTYTTVDGLAHDHVAAIAEDHLGTLWFATYGGVSRFDGVTWRTYTTVDGLGEDHVSSIAEDRYGNLWFGTYGGGVSRFDGVNWRTYTTADGLANDYVDAITEDHSGNMWFGTYDGLSRFDGLTWHNYTRADGLASNHVVSIGEDRYGNLWLGTPDGLSRYDGVNWHTYTQADGLLDDEIYAIIEDSSGNWWFGNRTGVSRYNGIDFGAYGTLGGSSSYVVHDILEDRSGALWFVTSQSGVIRHEPDLVAPQTVISAMPPRLSANRMQTIGFTSAYHDLQRITFSHSFDNSPWSSWSSANFWLGIDLQDGEHVFMVRARDEIGNVDSTAALCTFEIDATPPIPTMTFPGPGEPLRGLVALQGTASDRRFGKYCVEVSPAGANTWDLLVESASQVVDGTLYSWDTSPLPDGNYSLRFSVTDTIGLSGTVLIGVIVDNQAPWAYETAPAMVSVTSGGHIYTTNGEVHLYFPPRAFAREAEVDVLRLDESEVPDTLESGASRVTPGYEIAWGSAVLEKAVTLEMSYVGWEVTVAGEALMQAPACAMPALYVLGADSTWRRVGGTVDGQAKRVSAAITESGCYALFREEPGTGVTGANTLSALSLTPRVFAPNGTFANDHVAIGFTLGRSAPVTVKVYNRAGRLVREVVSGQTMGAGANLVRWDGRDDNALASPDGLYLVSVEAMGESQTKTISIVR